MQRWTEAMRGERFAQAWALAEAALKARDPATRDDPRLPYHQRWVWDGRPFTGRNVLVRCYHGLGDTLQFARFLPLLGREAASVSLEVQPRLLSLLAQTPGLAGLIAFDPAYPTPPSECDIEITELAFALRAPPAAVPPPYLHAPPTAPAAALPPGTIGLCYRAGDWDAGRSIPPALLEPLCRGRACVTLVAEPTTLPVVNPAGCSFDVPATAALVASCALVITVDTMIAHLAGALGRPTWLLLKAEPDWRWSADAPGTPWYPAMRLFHQQRPGDWEPVLREVAAALACQTRAAGAGTPPSDSPLAPVSWGELVDKITILEIKRARIADPAASANVARELAALREAGGPALGQAPVTVLRTALKTVNEELWEVEDAIRREEAQERFGPEFVRLARAVYRLNDRRAALKREVNALLGSALVEEKSYGAPASRPRRPVAG